MVIRASFVITLILFLSSCGIYVERVDPKALKDERTVIAGRLRIYQVPKVITSDKPVREISHFCQVISEEKITNSPFSKHRVPWMDEEEKHFKFYDHGLFAITSSALDITTIKCHVRPELKELKESEKLESKDYIYIRNVGLELRNIVAGKINYVGDIAVYTKGHEEELSYETRRFCHGGSSPTYIPNHRNSSSNNNGGSLAVAIVAAALLSSNNGTCESVTKAFEGDYLPSKISLINNQNQTISELEKFLTLPNLDVIFNQAKLNDNLMIKLSKDKVEFPF